MAEVASENWGDVHKRASTHGLCEALVSSFLTQYDLYQSAVAMALFAFKSQPVWNHVDDEFSFLIMHM